jgi:NADPH2:quinone reductase
MSEQLSQEIRSKVTSDGEIEISIATEKKPMPAEDEVLIKVEASPINPSDLGLLITFAAQLDTLAVSGSGANTKLKMKVREEIMPALQSRINKSMKVGNEGGGIIEAAGANVQELIGKTVGVAGGAMYSQYRCIPAKNVLVMDSGTSSTEAASSFVNPLTALGFVETMRLENHSGIVHTAAASNLGKMLVKICKDDDVPLVNIVRTVEQVKILKNLGAEYVCNSSEPGFMGTLVEALSSTGATLGFDATGGGNNGKLAGQILTAMELAATRNNTEYSRYGSDVHKQVYIYGGLDQSPTILKRSFGMQWGLGGWLLTPMIGKFGGEKFQNMRTRVAREIKTTFASGYTQEVSFEEMLQPEILRSYAKRATGEKHLVLPHKK